MNECLFEPAIRLLHCKQKDFSGKAKAGRVCRRLDDFEISAKTIAWLLMPAGVAFAGGEAPKPRRQSVARF
jgi:hypothetical protein